MKKSFVLTAALTLSTLALALSTPYASRTAQAFQQPDKCNKCLEKIGRDYQKCVEQRGEADTFCGEELKQNVIRCYATVCEQ